MNDPTVLRAFGFAGEHDAPRSARRLTAAARTSPVLDDAAVVTWPADHRRPLAWQARELAVGHRLSGAFWGLLFAQLFLLPLSLRTPPALPVTGIDDGLRWLGVDIGFVHAVREHVRPGTSALFVLDARDAELPLRAAVDLASLRLTAQQVARLRAGFDDEVC